MKLIYSYFSLLHWLATGKKKNKKLNMLIKTNTPCGI